MIDSLPIRIKYDNQEFFKNLPHIKFSDEADITINCPVIDKYNIIYIPEGSLNGTFGFSTDELWVETLDERIELEKAGIKTPIIVLTKDKELLPYCMKDRLAYLQDRINKEKGRYK